MQQGQVRAILIGPRDLLSPGGIYCGKNSSNGKGSSSSAIIVIVAFIIQYSKLYNIIPLHLYLLYVGRRVTFYFLDMLSILL